MRAARGTRGRRGSAMAASMICSRVAAGLRGSGLRASLGSTAGKVAAARERGWAGPGLKWGRAGWARGRGLSLGSAGERSVRLSPLPPPSCPALPCGGAGSPAFAFGARPPAAAALACGKSSLRGSRPFLSSAPSPVLLGSPRVSTAVTLRLGGVGLCQLSSFSSSHLASLCSRFPWMPFVGAGLFLAAAPLGSGDTEELGRLQCV